MWSPQFFQNIGTHNLFIRRGGKSKKGYSQQ